MMLSWLKWRRIFNSRRVLFAQVMMSKVRGIFLMATLCPFRVSFAAHTTPYAPTPKHSRGIYRASTSNWMVRLRCFIVYTRLSDILRSTSGAATQQEDYLVQRSASKQVQILACWDVPQLFLGSVRNFVTRHVSVSKSKPHIRSWKRNTPYKMAQMGTNGITRYVCQLKRLTINYCRLGGSSKGMRQVCG